MNLYTRSKPLNNYLGLIVFLGIISLFSSCNDSPANVQLITDTLDIKAVSSSQLELITGGKTEKTIYDARFNRVNFALGNFEDLTAFTFLRYSSVPDSLEYLEADDIDSVYLYLYPSNYAYGDVESMNLDFDIHELSGEISNTYSYSDVFDANGQTSFKGDFLKNFNEKINIELNTNADSSLLFVDPIPIPMDKEFLLAWLDFRKIQSNYFELTNNGTDNTLNLDSIANAIGYDREKARTIYSLGLFPNSNSDILLRLENIAPSGPSGKNPYINVGYTDSTGVHKTFFLPAAIVSYYIKSPEPSTTEIDVQGLLTYRGVLSFDVSMIPKGSPIHAAELEVTLIKENTVSGSDGLDQQIAGSFVIDGIDNKYSTFPASENYPYFGVANDTTDIYFFPSITSAVEEWVSTDGKGELMLISSANGNVADEFNFYDKLSFYGPDAENPENRPKLKIIYSTWPE
ncbi:hypothetical protein OAQ99_00695 [Candidatus Kapabacteria bacterium]|nr:hypothetical protein [Candidatus Kapabacteria bacterium]